MKFLFFISLAIVSCIPTQARVKVPLHVIVSDTITLSDSVFNFNWTALINGNRRDISYAIKRDKFGNIFIAGSTTSSLGLAYNAFDNTVGTMGSAFVGKFSSKGNKIWITYFGGSVGTDVCNAMAIDGQGNVVITGRTHSYQNDLSYNGFHNTYRGGGLDAFVAKFDSNGNRLWASYLGGGGSETGLGIAVDSNDDIYVTGGTESTTGIAYLGPDTSFNGYNDAFLTKIGSSGNLIWSTYFGGTGHDIGRDIAIDQEDNVLMIGSTWSQNGIALNGFDNVLADINGGSLGGSDDAFLAKFDSNGNQIWGTYFGGDLPESGDVITLDNEGNIFFSGVTNSVSAVAYNGFDMALNGYRDVYLAKFNSAGQRVWVTYFGGEKAEDVFGVATNEKGDLFIVGRTLSQLGIANKGFDNEFSGTESTSNGFIAKYNSNGEQLWASYYSNIPYDIVPDSINSFYITGYVQDPATFQDDAFLTKISWEPRKFNFIRGRTFIDTNEDCVKNEDESPISDIVVTTEPSGYFGISDSLGNYSIKVATGNYKVKPNLTLDQQKLYENVCVASLDSAFIFLNSDTVQYNIAIKAIVDLPPDCSEIENPIVQQVDNHLVVEQIYSQYQWINCSTNTPVEGAVNNFFKPIVGEEFAVKVSKDNCEIVSECYSFISLITGTDSGKQSIEVFPNPTLGIINVIFPHRIDIASAMLISSIGSKVFEQNWSGYLSHVELDTKELCPGLYFLIITTKSSVLTFKIYKE